MSDLDDNEVDGTARAAAGDASSSPGSDPFRDLGPNFRMPRATDWNWMAHKFRTHTRPNLIQFQDVFYDWQGGAYDEVEKTTLKAEVNHHLVHSRLDRKGNDGEPLPFGSLAKLRPPNTKTINEVMAKLELIAHKDRRAFAAPCFLGKYEADLDPTVLVAFPHCIFDPIGGNRYDPTPKFFTFNVMPFDYVPDAPPPAVWLASLQQWWKNDPSCIDLLQEAIGYTLFGSDTSLHKIFHLVGPTRSGKGTIIRLLVTLLGARNVVNRTLKQLGGDFPLEAAIHKRAMVIAEARTSRKVDLETVAQVLISVSGADRQDVSRKGISEWKGDLPLVIWMATNTALIFPDSSGALATRMAVIPMTESFDGREDRGLDAKLEAELPGIFLWAHEGWRRLRANGKTLTHVASGEAKREEMKALGSEEQAFTNDRCMLDPEGFVTPKELIAAWLEWRVEAGHHDEAKLPGDFRDAFLNLHAPKGVRSNYQKNVKVGGEWKQVRGIRGVRLKLQSDLFEGDAP